MKKKFDDLAAAVEANESGYDHAYEIEKGTGVPAEDRPNGGESGSLTPFLLLIPLAIAAWRRFGGN